MSILGPPIYGNYHARVAQVPQGFRACTPRVIPFGLGILVRDPRELYKGYIKDILGKPF